MSKSGVDPDQGEPVQAGIEGRRPRFSRLRNWRARRREAWKVDALSRFDQAAATKGGEVAGRGNTQNLGTFGG